jgi:hypothetical protein
MTGADAEPPVRCSANSSPTLNLKLNGELFPVSKLDLFEKLKLFQDRASLLGNSEYEVQSQVSRGDFELFVSMLGKNWVSVSRKTCDSLSLLAKEFGFEMLSEACEVQKGNAPAAVEFVGWPKIRKFQHYHKRPQSLAKDLTQEDENRGESAKPRVTITVGGVSNTYETLRYHRLIQSFAMDLTQADEDGIEIEGVEGKDRIVERAIETVYSNTVAAFPYCDANKPFLVLVLWEIHLFLFSYSMNSSIYCLNLLHKMAPTSFEKARLLILSQCRRGCPEKLIPRKNADWNVIGNAVEMLENEKNGQMEQAKGFLKQLAATKCYEI